MNYNPTLDGVRGIAIILGILFHCHFLKIGWIGVQLFFVLSGYLITSILLKAKKKHRIKDYLVNFYTKRSLRIFPLYFLFMVFLIIVNKYVSLSHLDENLAWLLTYTYNIKRMFIGEGVSRYYTHLWSQAVEEQFYLIWPFIIYLTPTRYLKSILIALILLAPLFRYFVILLASRHSGNQWWLGSLIYNCTLTQADAFCYGALLTQLSGASITRLNRLFWPVTASAVGTGLAAQFIYAAKSRAMEPASLTGLLMSPPEYLAGSALKHVWGYSLINLMAMLLICYALDNDNKPWLSNTCLTFMGKISFGLYVYHLPLIAVFTRNNFPLSNAVHFLFYLVLLISISALSYRYYEMPFLRLKRRFD